jgi:peptidoglycan/LPS O-acetylase OafA/YrhL
MPELLLQIKHSAAFFFLCASCFAGTFAATIFSWTPARLFGNMSYSYYLVHGLPVITLGSILYHILNTPVPEWMVFAALPFVFVISVVPAFLLFVFVERPFSLRPRLTVAMPRAAA